MFSKLSLSIGAVLMLGAGVVRAAPSASDAEIYAAESGNPDSIDYANRMPAAHSPSNEEIEAGESGNPDSVGYGDRMIVPLDQISQADWLSLESGNPELP
jgi:hypothetical protein